MLDVVGLGRLSDYSIFLHLQSDINPDSNCGHLMANRVQQCRRVSQETYVLDHVLRLYSLGHNLGLNTNHNRISSPQLPLANERTDELTCPGPKNVPLTNSIHRRQSGDYPEKGHQDVVLAFIEDGDVEASLVAYSRMDKNKFR